jgi:CIC family chloride channel protein
MVGLIGVSLNQTAVLGTGAEFMERSFSGRYFAGGSPVELIGLLALLFGAKMLATGFRLGSGGSGGDMMPSLILGGALGGAYGLGVHALIPSDPLPPAAYALVGAAALFSGVVHAPITGIVLGIEMGQRYGLALPQMVACSVSALVSSRLRTASIYALKLEERGADVQAARRRPQRQIPEPDSRRAFAPRERAQ